MAQPTFGQLMQDVRDNLGDEKGAVFKAPLIRRALNRALDEMISVFRVFQLPDVLVVATPFTLTAGVLMVDPASQAEIANLNGIRLIEERPSGSSENYTPVVMVDHLTQRQASDKLLEYTHNGGIFQFIGATGDIQLRFSYYASGNAEAALDSAVIAIDDSRNFLGFAGAAHAGPAKGYTIEAANCERKAYGSNNPDIPTNIGGALSTLVNARLQEMQLSPVKPRMYTSGGYGYYR